MMKYIKAHLFITLFVCGLASILLMPQTVNAAATCPKADCSKALAECHIERKGCPAGTPNPCNPATHDCSKCTHYARMSSSNINSACLRNRTKDSCFLSVPTSYTGSYSLTGARARSNTTSKPASQAELASGNYYMGNHLGADLGTGGRANESAYAAADGKVAYAGCRGGGNGYTVVIVHDLGCSGSGQYSTVYRHMSNLFVSSGAQVKKGQTIGTIAGRGPCDKNVYAIHLHFEVYDVAVLSGTSVGAGNRDPNSLNHVMDSSADCMQSLCGGCKSTEKPCDNKVVGAGDGSAPRGEFDGSTSTSQPGSGGNEECQLARYLDAENCTFCGMFKILFNTASSAAKIATDTLTDPSRNIVSIAFLIWLAIAMIKSFGNLGGTTPGDLLKEIIRQGFRVALVAIILHKAVVYEAMDLTLNPVMETGLSFSQSLSDTTCQTGAPYLEGIIGYESGNYNESAKGGLSKSLGESIVCSIKHLEDQVGLLMGLGKYSLCLGSTTHAWPFDNWIPHPGYWITGIVLWLAGAVLLLAFPWCLVDCVLQMCIAASLVPCGIACFAFKSTQKYISIIWNFFLNAMFNFVFLAIIMYLINAIFKDLVGLPQDPNELGNVPDNIFVTAFSTSKHGALAAWGSASLKILGVCFLCWTFFDEAKEMATKFADSPNLGGSKGIGRMVGGTALDASTKTAKYGKKLGGKLAHKAGTAIANTKLGKDAAAGISRLKTGVRNKYVSAKSSTLSAMSNMSVIGGKGSYDILDADGNVIGKKMKFRAFGVEQERVFTKDADGNWTQQKDTHVRSGAEKAFEAVRDGRGNITKVTARDEDGNEYQVNEIMARHRILGIQQGELEAMDVHIETQADGSKVVVYENKDEDGNVKSKLVTDLEGNALRYKTAFTRSLKMKGFVPVYGQEEWKAYSHRTKLSGGDAVMRTRTVVGGNGQIQRTDAQLRGHYADRLINQNGSMDMQTYNEILSKTSDVTTAKLAIIDAALKNRGDEALSSDYLSRQIQTRSDGTMVITMTERSRTDPSKTTERQLEAKMVDDRLVIVDTRIDESGNIRSKKDNGIQSVIKNFTYNEQTKTYSGTEHYDFSAYAKSKSTNILGMSASHHLDVLGKDIGFEFGTPLSREGQFNKHLDRQDVMKGFSGQDYAEHILQHRGNDSYNTLTASFTRKDGTLGQDKKLSGDEVRHILDAGDVFQAPPPQQPIVAPEQYSQADITRFAQMDRDGRARTAIQKTSMRDYIELDNFFERQLETGSKKQKNQERRERLSAQAHSFMQKMMQDQVSDSVRTDVMAHSDQFIEKFSTGNNDTVVQRFKSWMQKEKLAVDRTKPSESFLKRYMRS